MSESQSVWSKKDFLHHNNRRKHNHDYRAPWKYHITITKHPDAPIFGSLPDTLNLRNPASIRIERNALGNLIARHIRNFSSLCFAIRILQYIIMPDHIHILVEVTERIDFPLGTYIGKFKSIIVSEWNHIVNDKINIFSSGFNDRIIYPHRSLDDVFQYIRQNPYRLAVRKMRPDFFERTRGLFINNREVQAYGNLFLLRNPFKINLIVHRSDSEIVFNRKKEECLYYASNGGVVVSAFISKREKEIRKEIEKIGGRIILIHDRPLANLEKPARHDFNQCSCGNLLLLSPLDYLQLPNTDHPPRWQCLDMNNLAEALSGI